MLKKLKLCSKLGKLRLDVAGGHDVVAHGNESTSYLDTGLNSNITAQKARQHDCTMLSESIRHIASSSSVV